MNDRSKRFLSDCTSEQGIYKRRRFWKREDSEKYKDKRKVADDGKGKGNTFSVGGMYRAFCSLRNRGRKRVKSFDLDCRDNTNATDIRQHQAHEIRWQKHEGGEGRMIVERERTDDDRHKKVRTREWMRSYYHNETKSRDHNNRKSFRRYGSATPSWISGGIVPLATSTYAPPAQWTVGARAFRSRSATSGI